MLFVLWHWSNDVSSFFSLLKINTFPVREVRYLLTCVFFDTISGFPPKPLRKLPDLMKDLNLIGLKNLKKEASLYMAI